MQDKLFIGGEFVDAVEQATFEVLNPHDLSKLAEVAEARPADVDRAVAAAGAAFPAWSRTAATERGRLLLRLADAIEANADELARLESMDTGHPIATPGCSMSHGPRPPSGTSGGWPTSTRAP